MTREKNTCEGCYYAIRQYTLADKDPKTGKLGPGLEVCRITEGAFGLEPVPIEEMRKDKGRIHCGPAGKYYWNPEKPDKKAPQIPEAEISQKRIKEAYAAIGKIGEILRAL